MGLENPLHIAILLVIILLLFGVKRLPELGRSLGEGMRGFKDSISGESKGDKTLSTTQAVQSTAPQPAPAEQQPARGPDSR